MSSINIDSIMRKVNKAKDQLLEKNDSRVLAALQKKMYSKDFDEVVLEATADLRECIASQMNNSEIAQSVINDFENGTYEYIRESKIPTVVESSPRSLKNEKKATVGYKYITVSYGPIPRSSLNYDKYGDVDILALFDQGAEIPNAKYVYGKWHGKNYRGTSHIDAGNFFEKGVEDFNANYGPFYPIKVTAQLY